jgi:hypothetical protein
MAARGKREWTVEDYEAVEEAQRNIEECKEAAGELGGPAITLVPASKSLPPEFLPDEVDAPTVPFDPEPSRKTGGWSAHRQQLFIEALAETGSVHLSAKAAGLSARSAYAVRVRSPAFAAAWDAAQQLAVGRLSTLAFDRAIHGRVDQMFSEGILVAEKRVPSDRLLMWLLARLDPKRFASAIERPDPVVADPLAGTQQAFPQMLGALTDVAGEWPHEREHCEHSGE